MINIVIIVIVHFSVHRFFLAMVICGWVWNCHFTNNLSKELILTSSLFLLITLYYFWLRNQRIWSLKLTFLDVYFGCSFVFLSPFVIFNFDSFLAIYILLLHTWDFYCRAVLKTLITNSFSNESLENEALCPRLWHPKTFIPTLRWYFSLMVINRLQDRLKYISAEKAEL